MSGPLDETPRTLSAPAACYGLCRTSWPPPVHPFTIAWLTVTLMLAWPHVGPGQLGGDGSFAHNLLSIVALGLAIALAVSLASWLILWPQMGRRDPIPVTVYIGPGPDDDEVLELAALDGRAWLVTISPWVGRLPRLQQQSRPRWALHVRPDGDPESHPMPRDPDLLVAGELILPRFSRYCGLVLHRHPGTSELLPYVDRGEELGYSRSEEWDALFQDSDQSQCRATYMKRPMFVPAMSRAPASGDESSDDVDPDDLSTSLDLIEVKVRRGDRDAPEALRLMRDIAAAEHDGRVVDPKRRAHLSQMLTSEPEPADD